MTQVAQKHLDHAAVANTDDNSLVGESFSGGAQVHGGRSGLTKFLHNATAYAGVMLGGLGGASGVGAVAGGAAAGMAVANAAQVGQADLVIHPDYFPQHEERGRNRSVLMGRNTAGIEYTREGERRLASAIMFTRHDTLFALTAGHVGVGSDFTVFTGWDAVNHRGQEFSATAVDIFPGYYRGMPELGNVADLALITLSGRVDGLGDLNFAPTPLTFGQSLTHGGFGRPGVWGQEEFLQDGVARAGIAYRGNAAMINGASADVYFTASLSLSDPDSSRGTLGSSGNPGQWEIDNILYTYGLASHASTSLLGGTTQFVRLDLENAPVHGFINERAEFRAGVPEPSAGFLVGVAALAGAGFRRSRRPTS